MIQLLNQEKYVIKESCNLSGWKSFWRKFFKRKILFTGHFAAYFVVFAQRESFLKNSAKCSCSGPPAFKCQNTEYTGCQTKNCSINISTQKSLNQSAPFIKPFLRYTWSPMDYKASPIFDHDLIIFKVTFTFHSFVSTKSAHFIISFLRKADFRVPRPKRPQLFLTTSSKKLLRKLFDFLNLKQHTKN